MNVLSGQTKHLKYLQVLSKFVTSVIYFIPKNFELYPWAAMESLFKFPFKLKNSIYMIKWKLTHQKQLSV